MTWGAKEGMYSLSFSYICFAFGFGVYLCVWVCIYYNFKEKSKDIPSFLVEGGGEGIVLAFQAWMFLLENPQPNGSMVSYVPRSPTINTLTPKLF